MLEELEDARALAAANEDERKRVEVECDRLRQQLADCTSELDAALAGGSTATSAEVELERSSLAARVSELESALGSARDSLQDCQRDLEGAHAELDTLRSAEQEARTALNDSQIILASQVDLHEELQAQRSAKRELQAAVASLQREVSAARSAGQRASASTAVAADLGAKLAEATTAAATASAEREALSAQVSKLRAAASSHSDALSAERSRVTELSAQLQHMKASMAAQSALHDSQAEGTPQKTRPFGAVSGLAHNTPSRGEHAGASMVTSPISPHGAGHHYTSHSGVDSSWEGDSVLSGWGKRSALSTTSPAAARTKAHAKLKELRSEWEQAAVSRALASSSTEISRNGAHHPPAEPEGGTCKIREVGSGTDAVQLSDTGTSMPPPSPQRESSAGPDAGSLALQTGSTQTTAAERVDASVATQAVQTSSQGVGMGSTDAVVHSATNTEASGVGAAPSVSRSASPEVQHAILRSDAVLTAADDALAAARALLPNHPSSSAVETPGSSGIVTGGSPTAVLDLSAHMEAAAIEGSAVTPPQLPNGGVHNATPHPHLSARGGAAATTPSPPRTRGGSATLAEAQLARATSEARLAALQKHSAALEAQLVEAAADRERVGALEAQLVEAAADRERVGALEAQLVEAAADREHVGALEAQLVEAAADRERVGALEAQLVEVASASAASETALREAAFSANAAREKAVSAQNTAEAELDSLRQQCSDSDAVHADLSSTLTTAQARVAELEGEIQRLREELSDAEADRDEAWTAEAEAQDRLAALQEQLATVTARVEHLSAENSRLASVVTGAAESSADAAEAGALRNQVQSLQEDLTDAIARADEATSRADVAEAAAERMSAHAQRVVQVLRSERTNTQQKVGELKRTLQAQVAEELAGVTAKVAAATQALSAAREGAYREGLQEGKSRAKTALLEKCKSSLTKMQASHKAALLRAVEQARAEGAAEARAEHKVATTALRGKVDTLAQALASAESARDVLKARGEAAAATGAMQDADSSAIMQQLVDKTEARCQEQLQQALERAADMAELERDSAVEEAVANATAAARAKLARTVAEEVSTATERLSAEADAEAEAAVRLAVNTTKAAALRQLDARTAELQQEAQDQADKLVAAHRASLEEAKHEATASRAQAAAQAQADLDALRTKLVAEWKAKLAEAQGSATRGTHASAERLLAAEQATSDARAAADEARDKLQVARDEVDTLQARLSQLEEDLSRSQEELASAQATADSARKRAQAAATARSSEVSELRSALTAAEDCAAAAQAEAEESKTAAAGAAADAGSLRSRLQRDAAAHKEAMAALRAQLTEQMQTSLAAARADNTADTTSAEQAGQLALTAATRRADDLAAKLEQARAQARDAVAAADQRQAEAETAWAHQEDERRKAAVAAAVAAAAARSKAETAAAVSDALAEQRFGLDGELDAAVQRVQDSAAAAAQSDLKRALAEQARRLKLDNEQAHAQAVADAEAALTLRHDEDLRTAVAKASADAAAAAKDAAVRSMAAAEAAAAIELEQVRAHLQADVHRLQDALARESNLYQDKIAQMKAEADRQQQTAVADAVAAARSEAAAAAESDRAAAIEAAVADAVAAARSEAAAAAESDRAAVSLGHVQVLQARVAELELQASQHDGRVFAPSTPPRKAVPQESPIRGEGAKSPFSDGRKQAQAGGGGLADDTPSKLAAALDALETASAPLDGRGRPVSPRSRSLPRRRNSAVGAEQGLPKGGPAVSRRAGMPASVGAADDSILSPSGTGASLRDAYTTHIRMLVAQLAEQEAEIFLLRSSLQEVSMMSHAGVSLADEIPHADMSGYDGSPSRPPHPMRDARVGGPLLAASPGGSVSAASDHTSPEHSLVYMDADYCVDGNGEHWYCLPEHDETMQRVPTPERRELVWSEGKVIDTMPPRLPPSTGSTFLDHSSSVRPSGTLLGDDDSRAGGSPGLALEEDGGATPVDLSGGAFAASETVGEPVAIQAVTADVSLVMGEAVSTENGEGSDSDRTASIRTVTPLNPGEGRLTSDSTSAGANSEPAVRQSPLSSRSAGSLEAPPVLAQQSSATTAETPIMTQPATDASDGWSDDSGDSFDDSLSASTAATGQSRGLPGALGNYVDQQVVAEAEAAPGIGASQLVETVLSPLDIVQVAGSGTVAVDAAIKVEGDFEQQGSEHGSQHGVGANEAAAKEDESQLGGTADAGGAPMVHTAAGSAASQGDDSGNDEGDGWEDADSVASNAFQGPPTQEMSSSASVVSTPMSASAGRRRLPSPEQQSSPATLDTAAAEMEADAEPAVDRTPHFPSEGLWLSEDYFVDGLGAHWRRAEPGTETWEGVPEDKLVRLVWAHGVVERLVMPGEDVAPEQDSTAAGLSPGSAAEEGGVLGALAAAQASTSWERDIDRASPVSHQGHPAAESIGGHKAPLAVNSGSASGSHSPSSLPGAPEKLPAGGDGETASQSQASDGWEGDSIASHQHSSAGSIASTGGDEVGPDAVAEAASCSSGGGGSATGSVTGSSASAEGSLPALPPSQEEDHEGVLVHTGSLVGFAATHSDDASPPPQSAPDDTVDGSQQHAGRQSSMSSFELEAASLSKEEMLQLVAQQGVFLDEHVYVDQLLVQYERDASGEWSPSPPEAVQESALREVLLARKRAQASQEAATPAPVEDDSEEGGGASPVADDDAPNIPQTGLYISEHYFVDALGAHWWMNVASGGWEAVPGHKKYQLVWQGGLLVDTVSPPQSEASMPASAEGLRAEGGSVDEGGATPGTEELQSVEADEGSAPADDSVGAPETTVPDRTATPPPAEDAGPPPMPAFFNPNKVTKAPSAASDEDEPSINVEHSNAEQTAPPLMTSFNPSALPPVDIGDGPAGAGSNSSAPPTADFWEEARRAAESQRTSPVTPKEPEQSENRTASASGGRSFLSGLMPSWLGGSSAAAEDDEMPQWEEERNPDELNPDKPPPIIPGFQGGPAPPTTSDTLDVSGVMGAPPGPSPPSGTGPPGANMFSLVGAKGKKGKRSMPRWASTFPGGGASSAPTSAGVSPASSMGAPPMPPASASAVGGTSHGAGGVFDPSTAFSANAQAALGAPPPPAGQPLASTALPSTMPPYTAPPSVAPPVVGTPLPEEGAYTPEPANSASSGDDEDSEENYESDEDLYDRF